MKKLKYFTGTAILFFLVTMPFRELFGVTGLTEIRPAGAFPVVFGMLFGIPGALGCAAGNLAADLLSGYPSTVCFYGFIAQFLYGWVPHLLWYGKKREKENHAWFHNAADVRRYILIVLADCAVMACMLGVMLQFLGLGYFWSQSTLLLFFNNLVFSVLLGIPLILLCSMAWGQKRKHVLTLNVRFVLIFLILSMLSAGLMGIASYSEAVHYAKDTLQLWNRVYIRVAVDFFILCGISVYFLQYLQKRITIPIETLSGIAASYAGRGKTQTGGEELTVWIGQCESLAALSGEPGALAAVMGKMMREAEIYTQDLAKAAAEKERIRTELTVAARLQADMLPETESAFRDRTEFFVSASMIPAKGVGGDFYDAFLLDGDHLALVMADVSGKGVPAALFMVVARTLIRSHLMRGNDMSLERTVHEINKGLCENNKNNMFVTAWIGVLTISAGELVFVNAGHCRPLIKGKDGSCHYDMQSGGPALAAMEGAVYRKGQAQLQKGDILFLYTDGVTEATDKSKELFGEKRLKETAERKQGGTNRELLEAVQKDIDCFQQGAEQFDDITMLAVVWNGVGFEEITGVARLERLREFAEFTENILRQNQVSMKVIVKILMALDEIFSNICYYSGAKEVTMGIRVKQGEIAVCFEDDGIPYNPLDRPDPDVDELLEKRRKGGLGIYLVKKRSDRMEYAYISGKNRLTIYQSDNCRKKKNDMEGLK